MFGKPSWSSAPARFFYLELMDEKINDSRNVIIFLSPSSLVKSVKAGRFCMKNFCECAISTNVLAIECANLYLGLCSLIINEIRSHKGRKWDR